MAIANHPGLHEPMGQQQCSSQCYTLQRHPGFEIECTAGSLLNPLQIYSRLVCAVPL